MVKGNGLVFGIGTNDSHTPVYNRDSDDNVIICPYYAKWKSRLEFCYYTPRINKQPTYKGCTVSEEWLLFSNFRSWMKGQESKLGDLSGLHLDKDFLSSEGTKVYSKDTCVFIDGKVNQFIKDSKKTRGVWPLGVHFQIKNGSFIAKCNNPFTEGEKGRYIGTYFCPIQAHKAWQERKHEYSVRLANSDYVNDTRVRDKLLTMYTPATDWLEDWTHPDE